MNGRRNKWAGRLLAGATLLSVAISAVPAYGEPVSLPGNYENIGYDTGKEESVLSEETLHAEEVLSDIRAGRDKALAWQSRRYGSIRPALPEPKS